MGPADAAPPAFVMGASAEARAWPHGSRATASAVGATASGVAISSGAAAAGGAAAAPCAVDERIHPLEEEAAVAAAAPPSAAATAAAVAAAAAELAAGVPADAAADYNIASQR